MTEFNKIKQEIFLNFCHQKDELLKNNCLIAELFDAELKEATDENPIIIKGGIGELKITKNKNSFTPNPKIWTATASEKQLIIGAKMNMLQSRQYVRNHFFRLTL